MKEAITTRNSFLIAGRAMQVTETDYGFEIAWNPDDPIECVFNDWTEEDFTRVIMSEAKKVLAGHTFEEGFLEK